jgi:hypothetical protein
MRFHYLNAVVLFVLLATAVHAQVETPSRVIVNSELWTDVYSVMQYGSLKGVTANFLVSDRHATVILGQIGQNEQLWAISSTTLPHIVGYQELLTARGYTAQEFKFENINLEMARLLPDINKFIILDDSYGYNAIAVAPYAAVTKSYVLFADSDTIDEVVEFLSERNVDSLLIFGQVDREVRTALDVYSPEIINQQGDRFLNNVEIVKKYMEVQPAKQVILTNGEFIEHEIMAGSQPVLFIGTNNVPEAIRNYVSSSDIEVGVLIGNELVGTATFIRRQLGISVFVKFAQGARQPEGRISQVEALDMFYLPTYTLNLEVDTIKYNRATNQLEVTLRNTEDQAVYLIGTYGLTDSIGTKATVGDIGPNFIDGNQLKTFVYDVQELAEGKITVEVFIIYGESPGSLEKEIRLVLEVDSVQVIDNCKIQINEVALNMRSKQFLVEVENIGEADCFTSVELVDLIIAGEKGTYASEAPTKVAVGDKKTAKIRVTAFEPEDAADNERITIRAYYGERENTLVKVLEGRFELIIKSGDYLFYTLIVVIFLLLFLLFWKRRKKKEEGKQRSQPPPPPSPSPTHSTTHTQHASTAHSTAHPPQHPTHQAHPTHPQHQLTQQKK